MIQQNNNEFDIASQPLQASRRQAGGRQGVLFPKKQLVVNQN